MPTLSPSLLAAILLVYFLAGMVKGIAGMGLPTVAMGLLGAVISPVAAAALLIVPAFVTNVWQGAAGKNLAALVRRLWPMLAALTLATIAASSVLAGGNARGTSIALGVALAFYGGFTLWARQLRVSRRAERWMCPTAGALSGLIAGGTGIFVIPLVPYLQALGLSREELIQALGLSFSVSTAALAIGLAVHGAFHAGSLAVSALALLPALLGMRLGQSVRQRIGPEAFRRWFLICLMVLGADLALRPFL